MIVKSMSAAVVPVTSTFIDLLRARAARVRRRIVFPETADLRVRMAIGRFMRSASGTAVGFDPASQRENAQ